MKSQFRVLSMCLVAFAAFSFSVAHAEDAGQNQKFKKKHPRRAEVLKRDKNEVNKNNAAAVNGKITNQQAQQLDSQDAKIKAQEQHQAADNGGHITKAEQRKDNREENQVNQERRQDEKQDAAAPAPASN